MGGPGESYIWRSFSLARDAASEIAAGTLLIRQSARVLPCAPAYRCRSSTRCNMSTGTEMFKQPRSSTPQLTDTLRIRRPVVRPERGCSANDRHGYGAATKASSLARN